MQPKCSGSAILKVIANGKLIEVFPADLDWQEEIEEEASDTGMGPRRTHFAEFEPDDINSTIVWNLWEYPLGAQEDSETDYDSAILELVQDFNYYLEHEPEDQNDPGEP